MVNRLIALSACALLALAIAGCGGGDGEEGGVDGQPAAKPGSEGPTRPAPNAPTIEGGGGGAQDR